jgi:phosphatidyl-myo-inositol alpha-mannosyltransferase
MKIAFFNKHLPSDEPNGVSVQVHRLAQALVSMGHAVTCFSFSPAPRDARYEVKTLQLKARSRLSRKFAPAAAFRKIDTKQFDIVHYHGDDYLCDGSARRVRTFYGSAFEEALHAGKPSRFLYQALFYCFEWMSCLKQGAFAGISKTTLKYLPLVKRYIPCGVPLSAFFPSGEKTPCPSILFIGDLDSRKRGSLLLSVFNNDILPQFPESVLTVVGPQSCGGRGVVYKGRLQEKELVAEYRKAWVYCLPSSYEGFGVPAIEAMACGTAVVATDNAGIREIITNGVNGVICTPQTLGGALQKVISDNAARNALAAEGLKSAGRYAISETAKEYEKMYIAAGKKAQ